MYSELIYTRCGTGIDISRGSRIVNAGFKVFACSKELIGSNSVDVPLLAEIAKSKLPYEESRVRDDGYLYAAPDFGASYLLSFHPVTADGENGGSYSRRSGNYINQVFIGDFSDMYPYEVFGADDVWDAQKRGEAFYYANDTWSLPCRKTLKTERGIGFEEIGRFVADGRRKVLMDVIAFLISQFSLPHEKRKFLIIREADERSIEMWIAAIESAFSPRMASGIPFATRLEGVSENRNNLYAVNSAGKFSSQTESRKMSPNSRIKAMLVGVDERLNKKEIRKNPAFEVLDGKQKVLSCAVDSLNPCYNLMTAFNERQRKFTQGFLQSLDFTVPSAEVLRLYSAYMALEKYEAGSSDMDLARAFSFMLRYRMVKTPYLEDLYKRVVGDRRVTGYGDSESRATIQKWLQAVESTMNG